ncbi:MAG TPA: HAD family phosphatase [Flavobacterium sp.]|jgi:FMN phosphatase YigB (HAD superfamily)|uniref:HAD family hydrolase n=1 Tax=Flavobacterium sp. TaxID=239 RepID=UPI001B54E89B|nr:HAD family phosphatase [Flavobacterium sp.]MBA4153293.1 haloacid dehalogenase [Flavobacterium sp.]MBP6584745.1 HAD family phosphatase [Flavobacterium sp.]HQV35313.1 HAD family phosphatase [Flavobacterium sp.]HQX02626.1 HAD family phosphatase [Flavobacterium sp.]HRZ30989.1 HAD family phosphatase [Flavobacterium sp.]
MINTIIFDFGNIFIDLDKAAVDKAFRDLGLTEWHADLDELNKRFEVGKATELEFIQGFQKHLPNASIEDIRKAWNAVLGDFPLKRLEFLQSLKGKYRMFLLTNTDMIHIDRFEHKEGMSITRDFYNCFEKVYYSYEMGIRKPNVEVFKFLLHKHELSPKRTLFIDDRKENTDAAASLGIQVWNLQVGEEEVTDLFAKKIISL